MMSIIALSFLLITFLNFRAGRSKALKIRENTTIHSLPEYYGYYTAFWFLIPVTLIGISWLLFSESLITSFVLSNLQKEIVNFNEIQTLNFINDFKNLSEGRNITGEISLLLKEAASLYSYFSTVSNTLLIFACLSIGLFGFYISINKVSSVFQARNAIEKYINYFFLASTCIAILATAGILFSVVFEAIRFFGVVDLDDFLFGLKWSPQMAIREDQVGSSGAFGAIPLFLGTILISIIALLVAVPIGLMNAIYLSEYSPSNVRAYAKPMLEILAGIPTVVYGFFAAITVAPFLRGFGEFVGLSISSESALGVGLVMGIMIIPLVSSLSDDVISAVPQSMRDGSLGLGATKSETIKKVILPAALPGIVGGVLLAASRAIGETMIVVMAAGLSAKLTVNPLDAVTTVTVQIVTLLVGDQEFDSPKTLAAFALGLTLFVFTLVLNYYALRIVKKYREQYE